MKYLFAFAHEFTPFFLVKNVMIIMSMKFPYVVYPRNDTIKFIFGTFVFN